MFNLKTFLFVCLLICKISIASTQILTEWEEPDAWGRKVGKTGENIQNSIDYQECRPIADNYAIDNNQLSGTFYKKLLMLLFDKKNFQEDEFGSYNRMLHISLTIDELKILENSNDPRDWDAVVSNVFKRSNSVKYSNYLPIPSSFITIGFEWLKNIFLYILVMPQMPFIIFIVSSIAIIILLHKKYNYGVFTTFIFLCSLIGFFYTYYECNMHLQIEELANVLQSQGHNPCENLSTQKQSWSVWNFFKDSSKEQCIEHLKKKNRINLSFCRPDDVALMYINDIILKQFQRIIEKLTVITQDTIEKVPFPYNYVAIGLFVFILPLFLKIIFKHLIDPRVWRTTVPPSQSHGNTDSRQTNEMLVTQLLYEKIENHRNQTDEKILNLERTISGVQILDDTKRLKVSISTEKLKLLDSTESPSTTNELVAIEAKEEEIEVKNI